MTCRLIAVASWIVGTVTLWRVGHFHAAIFDYTVGRPDSSDLLGVLCYVVPVLAILAAHEGGHWLAAHRRRVSVVGPFFLPAPIGWSLPLVQAIGTAGAFLVLRPLADPARRLGPLEPLERFDIAWAGLSAGFVVTLVVTVLGLWLSSPLAGDHLVGRMWTPGPIDLILNGPTAWHPMLFAARVGWFVTAIGLMTDGFHMASAFPLVWKERRWHVAGFLGVACCCLGRF